MKKSYEMSSQSSDLFRTLRVEEVKNACGILQGRRRDGAEAGSTKFASSELWVTASSQEWSEAK